MSFGRARRLGETWTLARAAGIGAGVTRLADISGLAGMGLRVFQAVRPFSRSLTVAQGKGGSTLAAKISAMLEAAEMACGERLPWPGRETPLLQLPEPVQRYWTGDRPPLAIDLDPSLSRGWVEGRLLGTRRPMPMPWDLLSLDFTRRPLEYAASSVGLATGNTREEAELAALCELLENHLMARFEELRPRERRALQIDAASIAEPEFVRELHRVSAAGFTPHLWSLGQDQDIPAIACVLFPAEPMLDSMAPAAGTACHPDAATAGLAALREAAQGRAALVAGTRDDIRPAHYHEGSSRVRALAIATLAFGDGSLPWANVPTWRCSTTAEAVARLEAAIARFTALPVAIFSHPPPIPGLHVVHALAPGLCNLSRARKSRGGVARRSRCGPAAPPSGGRVVMFAGPSIAGLRVPPGLELRPPAICGDLAALAATPPAIVGLVDGSFGVAPSVWHKEILELLASGVQVIGAASIGALRAAELADWGMEGVGAIYEAYRSGAIERDDAVMVLQAPEEYGFVPLTVPLVDAEAVLYAMPCQAHERRMMQRIVRTMPYETRTWQRCFDAYRARAGRNFPVSLTELSGGPSLKQLDARLLMERLQEAARCSLGRVVCPRPPMTNYYLTMLARTSQGADRDREPRSPDGLAPAAATRSQSIR